MRIAPKFLPQIAPKRGGFMTSWMLLRGKPLFLGDQLRAMLADLLNFNGKRYFNFADLPKKLFVVAADVLHCEAKIYNNGHLVDAVYNSCGLPFVFKTFRHTDMVVDGGICENLPSAPLLNECEEFGRVFGISFHRDEFREMPNGLMSYGSALIETAINNSVDRARAEIGPDFVYLINTHLKTFDFKDGLSVIAGDDHYQNIRHKVYGWLKDLTKLRAIPDAEIAVVPEPDAASNAITLMENIHKVYLSQHHSTPIRFKESALILTCYPLHKDKNFYRTMFYLRQRITFCTLKETVHCLRVGLFSDGKNIVKGLLSAVIRNLNGEKVNMTVIPTSVPPELQEEPLMLRRYLLFFFDPPLSPNNSHLEPYTLEIHDYLEDVLCDLNEKPDSISLTSDRSNVERVDVVAYLPSDLAGVRLSTYDVDDPYLEGGAIPEGELATKYGGPEPGFCVVGWRGNNLKLGSSFGMCISPPV